MAEIDQSGEAFEHAYFTNSYPQESDKTKCVTTVIKIMTFVVIFVEVAQNVGIANAIIQYTQLVNKVDSVIHTGAMALLISSAAKIISALTAHSYASTRTDRTPEKRISNKTWFRAVSVVGGIFMIFMIHLLNKHAETTVVKLSGNGENSLLGSSDFIIRVTDSIGGLQACIFWTYVLHLVIHFAVNRLNKIETRLPRIVDLHAFNSTPKKDD